MKAVNYHFRMSLELKCNGQLPDSTDRLAILKAYRDQVYAENGPIEPDQLIKLIIKDGEMLRWWRTRHLNGSFPESLSQPKVLEYGGFSYEIAETVVSRPDGIQVKLTPREDDLFLPLIAYPEEVLTYKAILEIWGWEVKPDSIHVIRVNMARLRGKIGDQPLPTSSRYFPRFHYIQTILDTGYKFDPITLAASTLDQKEYLQPQNLNL